MHRWRYPSLSIHGMSYYNLENNYLPVTNFTAQETDSLHLVK